MTGWPKHLLSSRYCSSGQAGARLLAGTGGLESQPIAPVPLSPICHLWFLTELSRGPTLSWLLPSVSSCSSRLLPGQAQVASHISPTTCELLTREEPLPLHALSSPSALEQHWQSSASRLGTQPPTEHLCELEDALQKLARLQQQQEVLLTGSPHLRRHLWGHQEHRCPPSALNAPGPWSGHHTALRLMATAKSMPARAALQNPMWSPAEAKTSPGLRAGRSPKHSLWGWIIPRTS